MAITIDRLSGGNTPADGSDPRTFPAIWNATAQILEDNIGEGGASVTVSDTAPTDPGDGDLWWKSDDGKLFVYYDTDSVWVDAAGPSVAVQSTAPTGYEGQLWLDSTDGSMYVYYTDPGGGNAQWIGAVSRSGGVLQVVSTTKTDTFTSSLAGAANTAITGLTASITPRSTSSKILVQVSVNGVTDTEIGTTYRLTRGGTPIGVADAAGSRAQMTGTSGAYWVETNIPGASAYLTFLDSPSTTSSTEYGVDAHNTSSSTKTVYINRTEGDGDVAQRPRLTSTITLMEIAG